MAYTQIFNNGPGARSDKHISINPRGITLLKRFRQNYTITDRVNLLLDDNGFLCFKFLGENDPENGCFRVQWQGKERTTPCILTSTKFLDALGIKIGQYNVVEKDGYLVSDCKTNPQDSL